MSLPAKKVLSTQCSPSSGVGVVCDLDVDAGAVHAERTSGGPAEDELPLPRKGVGRSHVFQ